MFSSNQLLELSGDCGCKEQIQNAIRMIIQGYNFKPKYYYMEDGNLYFSQYLLSDNTKKVEEIREEDIRVEYITKIVELHFESSAFEKGLQTSRSYMDVNGDGSKYKGWVIVLSSLNRELTIRPYWAFYHK